QVFPLQQSLHQQADPSSTVHIGSDETARRLQVGQQRSAFTDLLEIVDVQGDPGLARDGQQVQDRVGRTAGGGDARDRVLECRTSENVSGIDPPAQQIHHHRTAVIRDLVFVRV